MDQQENVSLLREIRDLLAKQEESWERHLAKLDDRDQKSIAKWEELNKRSLADWEQKNREWIDRWDANNAGPSWKRGLQAILLYFIGNFVAVFSAVALAQRFFR